MVGRKGRGRVEPDRSPIGEDVELHKRLRDLDRRLDATRAEARVNEPPATEGAPSPGMGTALRLGADFVAGVVLGAALGYGFDRLFGTSPWGLIVFLLLGFGAGVLSVVRSAGLVKPAPHDVDSGNTR